MPTSGYASAGRNRYADPVCADGNSPVDSDFHLRTQTPHIRPPWITLKRPQHAPPILYRTIPRFLRSHFQFAVNLMAVMVLPQFLQMFVRRADTADRLAQKIAGQPLLSELVVTLHFAFGLRSRSIPQGDIIEVKSPSKIGKVVGNMSEKEAVVIHIH